MAKTKRSPKGDAYANDFGQCLFDAVLDAYDHWLSGIPYVQPGTANSVSVHTHDELAENVWPPVEKLCIRLEAYGQGAIGARVERAYKDAQDYARIIDDYCMSNKFDFWLWESGDPASDYVETDNAAVAELLSKADSINEWDLTGGFYGVNRPEWVSAIAAQAVQSEIVKYGHPPTKDYSERAERWALECFWLAVQLCKRDMDDHEARQYLEQYLSKRMVVSETKDPIIHEALGHAFGTHIYRLDPQDAAEKGSALPAVVVEAQEVLIVRLREQETRPIELAHMKPRGAGTSPSATPPVRDGTEKRNMTDEENTQTILTDIRAALKDLLTDVPARERFRAKVAAYCKRLVEADKPGAAPVDTGVATCFGSVGSLAMIAALMKRGPKDLDEAYVLLGAIHDAGPHVGRVGQASPPEWDTEAQSVSGKEDPRILDWAQHAEWHSVIDLVDAPPEAGGLTPEAVERLPAWREKVEADCGSAPGDAPASTEDDKTFFQRLLDAPSPPCLNAIEMARLIAYLKRPVCLSMMGSAARGDPNAMMQRDRRERLKEIWNFNKALPAKEATPTGGQSPGNPAKNILRDIEAFERFQAAHSGKTWITEEPRMRDLLMQLAGWAEVLGFDGRPFLNISELFIRPEPEPRGWNHCAGNVSGVAWGEVSGLVRRMKPKATAWAQGMLPPSQPAASALSAAPPSETGGTSEAREIIKRGEEILEARKNPDAGKLKWADFGDMYDTWNRKAEDLIAKLCGPSLARKWSFANCRAMYHLDQDRDFCLEEQQRKQAMLHEHLANKSTGAAAIVTAGQPAVSSQSAPPDEPAQPTTGKGGTPVDLHKQSLDTRACGVLAAHQGWSDAQIAEFLGCSRTSLYRLPGFIRARKAQKESKKDNLHRGHWDAKRGQGVPGVEDDDDEGGQVNED